MKAEFTISVYIGSAVIGYHADGQPAIPGHPRVRNERGKSVASTFSVILARSGEVLKYLRNWEIIGRGTRI